MANHFVCVSMVVDKMSMEEKGMLKGMLLHGKDFQAADDFTPTYLESMGQDVTGYWVADKLESLFKEGLGIADKVKKLSGNYGRQLDNVINKVLIKSLKSTKPYLFSCVDSIAGAKEREAWIADRLLETVIQNMDEVQKQEMAKRIEEYLLEKGLDPAEAASKSALLLLGGIVSLNILLSTGLFGPSLAVLLLRIFKMSLPSFLKLSGFLAILAGPAGWVVAALSFLPTITSIANKRAYDKYILGVFLIGMARKSQNQC